MYPQKKKITALPTAQVNVTPAGTQMSNLSPMTGQDASIEESTVTLANPSVTEYDDVNETTILANLTEKEDGGDSDKEEDDYDIMVDSG